MKKYLLPLGTILCLFIGFMLGNAVSNKANAQNNMMRLWSRPQSKIDELLNYMQAGYVDELDIDSITEEIMTTITSKLDPHSAYIPKKDLEMVNSELEASFSGIGVQFNIQNDTINIVAVISGGPSEGVGILAGDKIVMVDDSAFTDKTINNEKVMHTLRGEKGTDVKLTIKRRGTDELLNFVVTRGDIPVHAVDAAFMATKKIGFIRVSKFAENTYSEFMEGLSKLKSQGAERYIIDLRENSGGFMDQAIRMANEFLEDGDMIVYSKGRVYSRYEAKANGKGRFKDVPMAVLIDDFSASASEIFAGAIQDNDRGIIIGRRSFGKGLVQQQIPFSDGSAIRLTVARYYTPSGRCIQKPYTLGKSEDYEKELLDRFERGEFFSADSIQQDTTVYYTKGGKVVHGGGGIMPDIFVGRDTSLYTPYFNRVVNYAYTYQFAYKYTDSHRQELNKYKDWESLEKHLIKANLIPEFVAYCKEKGIEPNEAQINKSRPLLTRLIHAYIIRDIIGDEGFYPIYERDDEITQTAIKTMENLK